MKISSIITVIAVLGLLVVLKMLGVGRSMIRVGDPVSNKIVITLDEATAGLDPVVRDEEHSILMSTHTRVILEK